LQVLCADVRCTIVFLPEKGDFRVPDML